MTGSGEDLRYSGWPAPDRLAWDLAVAVATVDFLEDRPRLAKWASSTQRNARNVVSALLCWLRARVGLPPEASLAGVLTPELLLTYVRERLSAHAPTTIKYEVGLIGGALEVFAPEQDWSWCTEISRRLGVRARRHLPSPRPIVHAAVLYDLGLQVMRESWNADGGIEPSLYRSGLAVALLAAAPMRIANFAGLEIGRQLRREGTRWTISLSAAETKTRRVDLWPISGTLSLYLDRYLAVVRPALRRRARRPVETAHLWIGDSGHPIGDQVLRQIIAKSTLERLGIRINPHSFRHCAATTFALERPGNALQSSALLGHASPATTERHYIIQQRQLVQQDYLGLLRERSHSASQPNEPLILGEHVTPGYRTA